LDSWETDTERPDAIRVQMVAGSLLAVVALPLLITPIRQNLITAPLLGHWAVRDEIFKIADVDALQAKLHEAGRRFEFHRYDCKHAFANETQTPGHETLPSLGYDAAAAALAWQRTEAFLARELR
jgi:dienelactone hydrolase